MVFTTSLRKTKEFDNVYAKKQSFANKQLIVYYAANNLNQNRLGIVVSKKIGNSVVRHRTKRLIKEAYRLNEDSFNKGLDIIFLARRDIVDKTFSEVESSLMHVKSKCPLL